MNFNVDKKDTSTVAILEKDDFIIKDYHDVLDMLGSAQYLYDTSKIIVFEESFIEDVFKLKTGIAGDIFQKCINYGVKLSVVGEFGKYKSKSLNDFIRECNRGEHFYFTESIESALDKLHGYK